MVTARAAIPRQGLRQRGLEGAGSAEHCKGPTSQSIPPALPVPRQGQAGLGDHASMFKLWGKRIFPFSLPLPHIPEAGPGSGYQAAKALGGTHPASWHEAETADGSFSSAAIKQVPTGDWLAARRGNYSP